MKIDICKVVICVDGGNPLNESAVWLNFFETVYFDQ